MDGLRSEDEIVRAALQEDPSLEQGNLREAVRTLVESGFVEDAGAPPPSELSPQEMARYDRSVQFFSWVDVTARSSPWEQQVALKKSGVVVLGIGGVGSAVSSSLVAAGVGKLLCVDFDVIEESNLNRQLLYTEEDIGKSKVATSIDRLRRMNRNVAVSGRELRVEKVDDVRSLLQDCDLFYNCADTPATIGEWVNQAALDTRTPWIDCAYVGPMVVTGLFVPFETPCYLNSGTTYSLHRW